MQQLDVKTVCPTRRLVITDIAKTMPKVKEGLLSGEAWPSAAPTMSRLERGLFRRPDFSYRPLMMELRLACSDMPAMSSRGAKGTQRLKRTSARQMPMNCTQSRYLEADARLLPGGAMPIWLWTR